VPLKNIFPDEGIVNALMLNNNGTVTTLLFDVSRTVDEQLLALEPYGLTYTEGLIVKMVLEGSTNAEIAKKFCIARSTLKSHLNHIYRKIPLQLRKEIMGNRSGSAKIPDAPVPKKQEEAI
jgi:DNA-binding CsgD family transcriptional regulator